MGLSWTGAFRIVQSVNSLRPLPAPLPQGWYVVWTEPRAEKKVAERLESKGWDVWLPTVTEKRRWSDRWKLVTLPLFPGYLFTSTRDAGYVPALRTPGVRTLVKDGGEPAVLSQEYIERLRTVVEHPLAEVEAAPEPFDFVPGDEVLVREGPLAGFRGFVTELRGARRLLVCVSGIGRGLLCVLGAALVQPVVTAE